MTLRLICIFLIALAGPGCKRSPEKAFFRFDDAEHFFLTISDDELQRLYIDSEDSREAQERLTVIEGEIPETLRDSGVVQKLETLGYRNRRIPPAASNRLRAIFAYRPSSTITTNTCMRVYRDIIVFRTRGRITGIAKICFDCDASHLIGARYPADAFGMHGEYGQLRSLLAPGGRRASYLSTAR